MKTRRYQMLALAVALIAMSSIAYAQRGQCQGCGNYNPSTEITINGVVEEVVHMPASGRGPGGVHLMVRADAGTFDVHLGPASFIDAQPSHSPRATRSPSSVRSSTWTVVTW